MERKIGDIFKYNGEWYQCVEGNCAYCSLKDEACEQRIINDVCKLNRIFKKLEKVGEPFTCVGKRYQYYKVFDIDNVYGDVFLCVHNYKAKTLTIEIKQTKEDMEEKKLKLKPFDLEAAKAGKPVCTRDGRKARIICFDKGGEQPIVALIEKNEEESIDTYFNNGHSVSKTNEAAGDLMMLLEKKEGWVNVYYDRIDGITFSKHPYPSKEEAIKNVGTMSNRIDTVKISWEE